MCCHISNKTAYAEEEQIVAESMEPENDAKKANDDDDLSGTSGPVDVVEKKNGSPSYSHSSAESQSK